MRAVRVIAAFIAGMLCAVCVAWSQAYPAKPVRVIIPFPPGGANDIVARILLPKLSEQMGQQFIIENRSGAGGTTGSAVAAQSKPDGYTLLVQTVASHSNPHLYKKLPYDALAIHGIPLLEAVTDSPCIPHADSVGQCSRAGANARKKSSSVTPATAASST